MSNKWEKTDYDGVYGRAIVSKKHGIGTDRSFSIRYQFNKMNFQEIVGKASGGMTPKKAFLILSELKENQKRGTPPFTLKEKRSAELDKQDEEKREAERADKESTTFSTLFQSYLMQQQADGKKSWRDEQKLFKNWIEPVIGKFRLIDIAPIHFERIKANMKAGGKRKDWGELSPRYISYGLAVCRQVFNYGRKNNSYHGENPVCNVKKPSEDNRRMRFLTHDEAQALLDEIRRHSVLTWRITLISLHCGLRFGEIAGLTWQDLNFNDDTILIRNSKNKQSRVAFMTDAVKNMFLEMEPGKAGAYVFQNTGTNERMAQIPDSFMRAVNKIGLNDSIEDDRLKVVFHTCRHSFASWLVADGTDLFQVKELMGHKSIAMAARYSHLSPDTLRRAVRSMENSMIPKQAAGQVIPMAGRRA